VRMDRLVEDLGGFSHPACPPSATPGAARLVKPECERPDRARQLSLNGY